ncbi:MAG: hypothetical protein AAB728_02415, partial [Patescibacteria group bacterium]
MEFATFLIGLLMGAAAGGAAVFFYVRKASHDAEKVAEAISARVMTKQTEQILQLAETKLSGKKELIDGSLKAVKDDLDRVERLMRSIGDGNVKIDTRLENAAQVIKELNDTAGNL